MAPAPSSYEEIARSRPRIRRDVLFTRTPDGVLFHNAHGGFNVVTRSAYRFAALIVPHLDGERRVEELCAGLGDKQRDMVVQLVRALYARGFARDAGPRPTGSALSPQVTARFAHQLDYLDHYADDAHGRFARYRDTRVAVLGDDEMAGWAALGLLRNGLATVAVTVEDAAEGALDHEPRSTGLDVEVAGLTEAGCAPTLVRLGGGTLGWADLDGWDTVLVTGAGAPAQLLRLLSEGVPDGRRLLGAWTFGERAVVGPVMTAGTPGCWSCAALRLGAGADAADSADLWSGLGPAAPVGTPARVPTGPLAGMLGNLLAFEVFRLVTEALPAETRNQVIVQDLNSLDVLAEPLLPHPRCRFCASGELKAADGAALRVPHADDEPAVLPADGPADEAAAKGALAALELRDVLVREAAGVFGGYADDDWEQTPLKVSTVRLGVSPGRVREVSAIDVHHVAGARLAALFRGAEVYAEHVVPPRVGGEGSRVAPAELALSSGLEAPVDQVAAWSEATSLLDGRAVLVPTGAVRTLGGWNDQGLFERTSAGTGAAGTARAALARALRSALTHDALRRAIRRAAPVRLLDLNSLTEDAELLFLLSSAENLGVTVEVLDLTEGAAALPVALARCTDPESGAVRWAPGSGLRPREAVLEALRDLLGAEQMRRAGAEPDLGDPLWADLEAAALVPEGEPVPLRADGTDWAKVLDALAAAGRDAFAVPVAAPDLAAGEIHAVRVLLTGGGSGAH
ncbi:TOMM precursor leader peptide-binding protein [Streptomyces bauhiniae]|uniref:TOMM leader peptide-binding protein n=1 Tax=Streptomyces bauhiniae TaxID=2340725 RepID=A0A4Z1DAT5_9ACTN|nr:TOMM precursor leader peptide-binding protein [Streptomyces bauhiniae]TGN79170.1 TOMM precursor leader peptide-binding protein [Streptomyces bauhiniae]